MLVSLSSGFVELALLLSPTSETAVVGDGIYVPRRILASSPSVSVILLDKSFPEFVVRP
jgi:hypothetical protein